MWPRPLFLLCHSRFDRVIDSGIKSARGRLAKDLLAQRVLAQYNAHNSTDTLWQCNFNLASFVLPNNTLSLGIHETLPHRGTCQRQARI